MQRIAAEHPAGPHLELLASRLPSWLHVLAVAAAVRGRSSKLHVGGASRRTHSAAQWHHSLHGGQLALLAQVQPPAHCR